MMKLRITTKYIVQIIKKPLTLINFSGGLIYYYIAYQTFI
jgi:hypothetical protein